MPAGATSLHETCAAIALTLPPGAVFSHQTAAALWRLPLPHRLGTEVHITSPTGTRARRGKNLLGHQRSLAPDDLARHHGLALTEPGRTFTDLADSCDLIALVAIGDAIARRWGKPRVESAVARVRSTRRITLLREALALLDPASESPKESELRVLLTMAGISPLTANPSVYDARGRFIARVDLAITLRIAIEYEGDHHRDKAQWRKDIARRRRLEAEGWIYLSVTQADLSRPAQLLADVRTAIEARRREHLP